MSLHFIFGRAGTGKTARCCEEIARYMTEAPERTAVFLVPDQATYRAESMLAAAFPGKGFADVAVCGFARLSYRVFQELHEDASEALSPLVQQLILRRLLLEHRGELSLIGEAARQPHFARTLTAFFHQLDSFQVSEDDLAAAARAEGETPLGRKLSDLALLFSSYRAYLRSHFQYRGNIYDKLAEDIPRSERLRSSAVWIDGFNGMIPQELAIVSALVRTARDVTVTLPMDPPEEAARHTLFDRPYRLWKALADEAGRFGAVTLTRPHRFTCPRVRELAEQFFRPFPKPCIYPAATRTLPEQGVYVTEAPSREAEADDCARRIALLVREKGFRWRDILVLLRNGDAYADIVRRSFAACGIPAFIDQRRPMKNHPLVVLTDAVLRFLAAGARGPWRGWTKELLFPILKTDLLRAMPTEDVDRLENYVLRVGIRPSQWQSEWKFHSPFHLEADDGMPTHEELEELNAMNRCRLALLDFLIPLEDAFREAKTVRERCALLYRWFMDQGVPEVLARWDEDAYAETKERPHLQVWKKVLLLLDDLVRAAGGDEVPPAEFLAMAEDGLSSLTFSMIPPTLDHVTVTTVDRGYAMEGRAVFLLGAVEGDFPARVEEAGLLSEAETRTLADGAGLAVGPGLLSLIYQEEFYTYLALTRARQALYLSWPAASSDGSALSPSPLLARMEALGYVTALRKAALPTPDTDDPSFLVSPELSLSLLPAVLREGVPAPGSLWDLLRRWALARPDARQLLLQKVRGFTYQNAPEALPPDVVQQLFLKRRPAVTSVTRLETYRQCPYQYFLKYGLRLDERDRSALGASDYGSYLHAGLHSFGEYMKRQQKQWRNATDEDIDTLSAAIAERVPLLPRRSAPLPRLEPVQPGRDGRHGGRFPPPHLRRRPEPLLHRLPRGPRGRSSRRIGGGGLQDGPPGDHPRRRRRGLPPPAGDLPHGRAGSRGPLAPAGRPPLHLPRRRRTAERARPRRRRPRCPAEGRVGLFPRRRRPPPRAGRACGHGALRPPRGVQKERRLQVERPGAHHRRDEGPLRPREGPARPPHGRHPGRRDPHPPRAVQRAHPLPVVPLPERVPLRPEARQ